MRVSCETAARKRVFEATLGARRLLSPIIYDEMCDVRMPAKPYFPFLFLFEKRNGVASSRRLSYLGNVFREKELKKYLTKK